MENLSTLSIDLLLKIAAPLGVFILLLFFWYRAGSTHSIMERMWRIVAGSTSISDPRLAAFMQETRELERFRFIYGIRIASLADLHRLLAWRARYRVPVVDIQLMRDWFDIKVESLFRRPSHLAIAYKLAICLILFGGFVTASFYAVTQPALFKTNTSNVWFKTDGITLEPLFQWEHVSLHDCSKADAMSLQSMGFTAYEQEVICNGARDGSLQPLIEKAKTSTRKLGLSLQLILLVILTYCGLDALGAMMAYRLPKQLRQASSQEDDERQTPADFQLREQPITEPVP